MVMSLFQYNPLTLCENILYRMFPFLWGRTPRLQSVRALISSRKVGLRIYGNRVVKNFSPHILTESLLKIDFRGDFD